jgi:hypothetical protein
MRRQEMQDWLRQQVANGFQAFAGTVVSGSIHLNETVVNELLAALLRDAVRSEATVPATDARSVVRLVQSARVRIQEGAVVLDVELRV